MRRPIRRGLVVVALSLSVAACGSAASSDVVEHDSSASEIALEATSIPTSAPALEPTAVPAPTLQESPTKDRYAVGDTARAEEFLVRVDDAQLEAAGEADADYQLLKVDLTLENSGAESKDVAALLQYQVEDAAGNAYPLDLSDPMGILSINGSMNPGEPASGTVVYKVPREAAGLSWVFVTLDLDTGTAAGRVVFDVAQ